MLVEVVADLQSRSPLDLAFLNIPPKKVGSGFVQKRKQGWGAIYLINEFTRFTTAAVKRIPHHQQTRTDSRWILIQYCTGDQAFLVGYISCAHNVPSRPLPPLPCTPSSYPVSFSCRCSQISPQTLRVVNGNQAQYVAGTRGRRNHGNRCWFPQRGPWD